MRHNRRALLFRAEIFFRFAHFRPLQVSDFRGKFINRRGNNGQGRYKFGMAIALQCLCRNGCRQNTELFADIPFNKRIHIGVRADSTRYFSDRYDLFCPAHAFNISLRFGKPYAQLQAEGRRFRMNAVGSTDNWRVLELDGATAQNQAKCFQVLQQNFRRLFQHISQCRVLHVCRCKTQVNVFPRFTDIFGKVGNEGGNVMVRFRFNRMNALYGKGRFFTDFLSRFLRNISQFRLCFTGQDFHLHQRMPFILFAPNMTHFFIGISFNHADLSFSRSDNK